MANPRDLAEQAFALLQNALSESEARASDLDDQLKRKRQPKNRLEEQLDVLTHRIENVEAERLRWEQQAGHLEEIAEAERAKVAQLKKKLEIAETGPEKLTKKEINFWRAKAESIDSEITEYKNRLAALRRELNDREAAIARLETAKAAAEPAAPTGAGEATSDPTLELRGQLEQRDRWLAELRLELHELRAEPTRPLETEAEIETLRARIRGLEQSLGGAANARAAVDADLARAQYELAQREHALRETIAAGERERTTLAEREHRLVELSAETEHLRNDLRQRAEQQRAESIKQAEHATLSEREIEGLRTRLEQEKQEAAATRAELQGVLIEREREFETQRQLLVANEADFRELRAQLAHRDTDLHEQRRLLTDREQALAEARRQLEVQSGEIHERERELADRSNQLRDLGHLLSERDRETEASVAELGQARAAFDHAGREIDSLRAELERSRSAVGEASRDIEILREALEGTRAELERVRAGFATNEHDLAEVRTALVARENALATAQAAAQAHSHELEHARVTFATHEREFASLRETLLASSRELDELRADKRRLEAAHATFEARLGAAASEGAAAREQIAGLELELKEEREHAESVSELANERRDHMTKLQEQVEEAEERFAEASWKLGKSQHFQRIVKRRRGLVVKLLNALRAKMKANTALKAGLDGLRTYKAAAEQNQQKLLQRMDQLKAELVEAEETIKQHQSGTAGKQELATAIARATALEERLNTQAELIQTLEADLRAARLGQKAAASNDDKHREIEQLRKDLETKNQVIIQLQTDTDEQQRKLSKLRGSESETVRLKALTEKDRSEIEILQREISELREAAAAASAAAAGPGGPDPDATIKERDGSITRLMNTVKEHETTIKKLTELADSWKRKYQFLASDSPEAYKNGEK
jgi:chromosome segregation ATPase